MSTTQDQQLSLRQYVLPYRNYVTGETGWQFGLPPGENSCPEEISVQVVHKNARTLSISSVETTRPSSTGPNQIPRPGWFWVPVRHGPQTKFASLIPPRDTQGSVPLSRLKQSDRDRIFCKSELQASGRPLTASDLSFSIPAVEEKSELCAGRLILADLEVGAGQVRWIRPLESAYKLRLWTSHLSRLAELKLSHKVGPGDKIQ